eukprot:g69508.t1
MASDPVEFARFVRFATSKPFNAERWGPVRSVRSAERSCEAAGHFLRFAHRQRLQQLFFETESGVWRTRLRRLLRKWIEHLQTKCGTGWEGCHLAASYLRPIVVYAALPHPGRAVDLRAVCLAIFTPVLRPLRLLSRAEVAYHPKERNLQLTFWDLVAARTVAGGRFVTQYGTRAPCAELVRALAASAQGHARYEALRDLVLLCFASLSPQPRAEIVRRLRFGASLRRSRCRWWLDLSDPLEPASRHKTVLDEWRWWGTALGASDFVFCERFPLAADPALPLFSDLPFCARLPTDETPTVPPARLDAWLVRVLTGHCGARAAALRAFHLRKLNETFLAQMVASPELSARLPYVLNTRSMHETFAWCEQHTLEVAERQYVQFPVFREALRSRVRALEFVSRSFGYEHGRLTLQPWLAREWARADPDFTNLQPVMASRPHTPPPTVPRAKRRPRRASC